ncbi:MAG: periplasmic heavy metal sensor [Acidobacteriaceae bacterium]|nr:periplasmic heavy metal sensor [Acidobacteriaceae bacterium]
MRTGIWIRQALLCLALALPVAAQNETSLPWWTSPVAGDLGLSQEQQQKIRAIVRSYRDRLFDARNSANKAEADLGDIFNEPTINLTSAHAAIERLAQARAESTRLFTQMSVELRNVLTLDQWRELMKRRAEVQRTKRNRDTDVAP